MRLDPCLCAVLVLRLYTTAAFKVINGPLRELASKQRTEPHPLPVTVVLLEEAIGRLRILYAPSKQETGPQSPNRTTSVLNRSTFDESHHDWLWTISLARRGWPHRSQRLSTPSRRVSMLSSLLPSVKSLKKSLKMAPPPGTPPEAQMSDASAVEGMLDSRASELMIDIPPSPGVLSPKLVKVLWRGLHNVSVGDDNFFMTSGGTDYAPQSTSTSIKVALAYTDFDNEGASPVLLRVVTRAFVNQAVDLSYVSCFPNEEERVYPPRTYLEPKGKQLVTVPLRSGRRVTFTILTVEPHISGGG